MKSDKELKEILFDEFDCHDDCDDIMDDLESMETEQAITTEEYDYIMAHYEDWLQEYETK